MNSIQKYTTYHGQLTNSKFTVINYPVSFYFYEELMNPYFNKGYNKTIDNYFSSLLLTEKFLSKNTEIVGTVRKDRW